MSEWKENKLGDLIVLNYGKGLKEENRIKGNVPVFSSAGKSGFHNVPLTNTGGLVIGRKGTIGKIFYSQIPFWCIDTAYYILPNNDKYDLEFLFYFLRTLGLEELNEDSAVPGLNRNTFYSLEALFPSLPEQRNIAYILNNLDAKIDLLNRQIKTLEKLAETLFRQWFVEEADDKCKEVKLKDVCKTITKGTTPTTLGKNYVTSGINFLKAESISDTGDFIESKFAFIDNETDKLLSRSRIQSNDVLITIAGTIGRVAIVPSRILPANTNQAIGIVRVKKEILNPILIYLLLKSPIIINDFESRIVHAVQPNLSLSQIGDISFRLPPKELLVKYSDEIELIFNKKEINNIQIRTLTQLRDSLLPNLMKGEVKIMETLYEKNN
jgi:type I restriction enzyme S subunit